MMRVVVVPTAFGQWQGSLYIDDDVLYTTRGVRPGCVTRDLLNWAHYNYFTPTTRVELEITSYE